MESKEPVSSSCVSNPACCLITILIKLAAIFAGLVFIVSGALKVADPTKFLFDVQAFQLVPYPLAYITALVLPWFEIIAGLALIVGKGRRGAGFSLGLLTLFFIFAIISANMRGIHLDCGCFGKWMVFPNTATHIAFNSFLAFCCFVAWLSKGCKGCVPKDT